MSNISQQPHSATIERPARAARLTGVVAAFAVFAAAVPLAACGPGDGTAAAQTAAPASAAASTAAVPAQKTAAPATHHPRPARTATAPQAPESESAARAPAAAAPVVLAPQPSTIGTVTQIETLTRAEPPSGAGAVIGGVLGAVVGHQFGGGNGRTLATAAGAVGGAVAGNAIEKQRSSAIVGYRVDVRLDDGSTRSFRLPSAANLAVGSRVRVEGANLTAA